MANAIAGLNEEFRKARQRLIDGWSVEEVMNNLQEGIQQLPANKTAMATIEVKVDKSMLSKAIREMSPILSDIIAERHEQDQQWGGEEHDDHHVPANWNAYLFKQLQRAATITGDDGLSSQDWRMRMVKVAALAIAAIESYDRKER